MLPVRLTAFPSPGTRRLAFGPTENWLRRHYWYIASAVFVLLILNELYAFGAYPQDWDWLFISGWITFLLAFKLTFLLPDKAHEALGRLAASQVLHDDTRTNSATLNGNCRDPAAALRGSAVSSLPLSSP